MEVFNGKQSQKGHHHDIWICFPNGISISINVSKAGGKYSYWKGKGNGPNTRFEKELKCRFVIGVIWDSDIAIWHAYLHRERIIQKKFIKCVNLEIS